MITAIVLNVGLASAEFQLFDGFIVKIQVAVYLVLATHYFFFSLVVFSDIILFSFLSDDKRLNL